MRVLSVNDVGFSQKAGSLYMRYHQQKEQLAKLRQTATLQIFGIGGIP
jgi:hypothetical protein